MLETPVADGATLAAAHLYPLTELYTQAGLPLPQVQLIRGEDVPQPFRSLLVHNDDMTPTLEAFYGCDLHLELLRRDRQRDRYFRAVVLRLNGTETSVEFGANRIRLDLLPPEVRQRVLEENIPLGHILKVYRVPHTSRPQAFFRVVPDEFMKWSLKLKGSPDLFGRRNTLRDPEGRALSEIIEILTPPAVNRRNGDSPAAA